MLQLGMSSDRIEQIKEWRRKNKDKVAAAAKRWREKKIQEDPEWHKKEKERNRQKIKELRSDPNYVEKDRAYSRQYYYEKGKSQRTPESRFKDKLRQKYGLTLERFEDLLEATGYHCPICGDPINKETAYVDHCHVTGIVRGLLCQRCNFAEGFLRTPQIALRMYEYMKVNELFYNGNGA